MSNAPRYVNDGNINFIKVELREEMIPYFTDDDIAHYLIKNKGDVGLTIYEMLIVKSEDSAIQVSGLTTQDTSNYFKRLASRYKRFNSGIISGG